MCINRFPNPLIICFAILLFAMPSFGQSLKVLSFNIRNSNAADGENRWSNRKDFVIQTIVDQDPDLVGTQETLPDQARYLQEKLPAYHYVGRSRETGPNGEQCGILIRRLRFDILEQGHFWLSETPEVPGSKSWDSSLPRMVTWVKVHDRESLATIYFYNTHFDHRGPNARLKSAELIEKRLRHHKNSMTPVVLVGDFNCGPKSAPVNTIRNSFVDTYATIHNNVEQDSGTGNRFRGKRDGQRIDFVFCNSVITIENATIDRREFNGRNPSDHFPVSALFELTPRAGSDHANGKK